jgi:hypothetical protein
MTERYSCLAAALVVSVACGPETSEPSSWMLGVFSTAEPGQSSASASLHQYRVHEGGELDYAEVDASGDVPGMTRKWSWKRDGTDAFEIAIVPDEEIKTDYRDTHVITRVAPCGPYEVAAFRDGEPMSGPADIWFGEVCVRASDCPVPGECDSWEYYWCDGMPPKCSDDERGE